MLCVAVLAAGPAAGRAGAQLLGTGTITGVVYDSLIARRPLAGAEVLVAGTGLAARTDAAGRFRVAGVPSGPRQVTFFHPSLEALRFGAPPQTVDVRPGQQQEVRLVTPSAGAVFRAFCPAPAEVKTGVLVGRVRGADTATAAAGADVYVAWNVFTVEQRGLVRTGRELSARTNADGSYYVCGVPSDVPVRVRVRAADGVVAAAEAALGDQVLGTAFVDLPALPAVDTTAALAAWATRSGAAGAPVRAAAYVAGVVRRADGRPFAGARVVLGGADGGATAGADGTFVLASPRAGPVDVEARAIGYRPVAARVDAVRGVPARVALTLTDNVVVLAATNVRAPRVAAALADFERRRRAGLGSFITNEMIEQRRPYSVADVLTLVPGVRAILPDANSPNASPRIVFQRASGQAGVMSENCEPITYLDGVRLIADPVLGLQLEQVLPRPQDVHGIEVYRNVSTAPAQYQPLGSSCGVILIWTNRGR